LRAFDDPMWLHDLRNNQASLAEPRRAKIVSQIRSSLLLFHSN